MSRSAKFRGIPAAMAIDRLYFTQILFQKLFVMFYRANQSVSQFIQHMGRATKVQSMLTAALRQRDRIVFLCFTEEYDGMLKKQNPKKEHS